MQFQNKCVRGGGHPGENNISVRVRIRFSVRVRVRARISAGARLGS